MKAAPHGGVYADRAVLGDEGEDGARLDDAQADGARVDVGHTVGTGDGPSTVAASPGGYPFFAMLARMKFINRWGLMRNTRGENIQEHSLQVAMLAHALATIRNRYFGGAADADRAAVIGIFHDCDEILTGDLPTPVKYYNDGIRDAYRTVESAAKDRLLSMLPETLRPDYEGIITRDSEADRDAWRLVKAADTLSAYIKCLEELASGNSEFAAAAKSTRGKLEAMGLPEVELFLREFIGAFSLSLDEFGI